MTSVRVVEPAAAASDPSSGPSGRRVKKEKYTLASLPFPRGAESVTYTREWRKLFKPTIIHWAATLKDPFGTNAVMGDIVKEVWSTVFPSIANEVIIGSQSRYAIIHLVSSYSIHKLVLNIYYQMFRQVTFSLTGVVPWVRKDFVLSFLHSTAREYQRKMHRRLRSITWRITVLFIRIQIMIRCVSLS